MQNIALEIATDNVNYQWAWLDDDTSVTVENVNPIFDTAAGGTFTHAISLDVARNSHIFGSAANFRGPKIYNLLRKKKARLWVMGEPITGVIRLDSELAIDNGKVEIEVVSNCKELEELLDGVNCRDVDISKDRIMLGYALPEYIKISFDVYPQVCIADQTKKKYTEQYYEDPIPHSHEISMPKVLYTKYPSQGVDCVNTEHPYSPGVKYIEGNKSTYPYCNVRACYSKYEKEGDNWEKKRGYMWGEPDRINSAPCFFVGYWFRKLWEDLNLAVKRTNNKDGLEQINDYNRLAFFHFDPHYDWGSATSIDYISKDMTDVQNGLIMSMNATAECDGRFYDDDLKSDKFPESSTRWFRRFEIREFHTSTSLYIVNANSQNFPDTEAKNVLECMQGLFGARYLYNSSMAVLDIKLVRDVLRDKEVIELPCVVISADKTEPGTQGFRLKYEGSQEAVYNGITKVDELTGDNEHYDADTNYNYTDFRNVKFISEGSLPEGIINAHGTSSQNISDAIHDYISLANHVTNSDKTCYVSTTTGNAYRIKVDSDAKTEIELFPSLFPVGMFQDFTEGDCSHEASEDGLIEEVTIPCTPIIPNDVNITYEKEIYLSNLDTPLTQKFAQLLDGEIHNIDKEHNGTVFAENTYTYKDIIWYSHNDDAVDTNGNKKGIRPALKGTFNLRMKGLELYDIAEDGPYYQAQHNDIVLGLMRGSGSDSKIEYFNEDYDKEQGEVWSFIAGSDAEFTSDTIDEYGHSYDYNGDGGGLGYDINDPYNFPLSLRLRAEKENPAWDPNSNATTVTLDNGTIVPNTRFFPITNSYAQGRGLGDRFYKEYAYWVLNRKILSMNVEATAAVLTGIDMTKHYRIGGVEGMIKQYNYSVDMKKGITNSKIELYYL